MDEACGPVELAGDRPQQGKAKQRARSGGPVCPQPGAQVPQLVADDFAHQSQGQHRGPEKRGEHPRCESVSRSCCSEWKGTAPRRRQHLVRRPHGQQAGAAAGTRDDSKNRKRATGDILKSRSCILFVCSLSKAAGSALRPARNVHWTPRAGVAAEPKPVFSTSHLRVQTQYSTSVARLASSTAAAAISRGSGAHLAV